ncbi:hypothetical protein CY34DRAFT_803936 [Suillus luteus UH-Slu-Lm8-n1]|uniref:Uncharacterized protein n=1 Tax=Suillus luteus UH-Slu-Lm8-n1 TaxID=930992 RepID=A0A0D0AND4_9AGAM|nr:hypothetical protein CY34DRAFT_803936 [Suillus luteus UH-Slu-Lm8-n1]
MKGNDKDKSYEVESAVVQGIAIFIAWHNNLCARESQSSHLLLTAHYYYSPRMAIERPSKRTSERPDEHEVDKLDVKGHGPVIAEADAARLSGRVDMLAARDALQPDGKR